MAYERMIGAFQHAGYAGVDLTGKLHKFVKQQADNRFILGVAGDACFGVVWEEGPLNGPVTVQFGGVAKVKCGAAINAGAEVQCDANGDAITLAAGKKMGKAMETGALNQIIPIELTP